MKIIIELLFLIEDLNTEATEKFIIASKENQFSYQQGFVRGMSSGLQKAAEQLIEVLKKNKRELSLEEREKQAQELYQQILSYCSQLKNLLQDEENFSFVAKRCRSLLLISEEIEDQQKYEEICRVLDQVIAMANKISSM